MTNNIHFITSHADNDTQEKTIENKGKSQQGWINLFDKPYIDCINTRLF